MERERISKEGFEQVRLLDPYKQIYMVYLSPHEIGDEIESTPFRIMHEPRIYEVRKELLRLIREYDTSKEVNAFFVGERSVWLDKATRVGLVNSLHIQKESGLENTTLWLNGVSYYVNIDAAFAFLSQLELYAIECYNVTQRHIAELRAMSEMEDLLAFDITEGYPEKLMFDSPSSSE